LKHKILLGISFLCLIIVFVLFAMGLPEIAGPFLIFAFATLATGLRGFDSFKGFAYTAWIFAAVTVAMYYPAYLIEIGGFQLSSLIVPLIMIIMFGMGTSMSLKDFRGVIKMPKPVFIGMACQFTIMPFVGLTLTIIFGFPPEIAAGVILIGSAPSGLASNVMSYLANANLALSITLTAVATVLAPLVTPALMSLLAGQFVPINFWDMMLSIVKMVIIPVVAGLIFNKFFHGKAKWLDEAMPIVSMAGIAIIIMIITAAGRDSLLQIGILLIFAGIIHNLSGYLLGYWGCRLFKMDEKSCRTIALEVGMQNGGLASGIALEMGKVATVGLAPAVFGPLMNITGSSLATWWRAKPIKDDQPPTVQEEPISDQPKPKSVKPDFTELS
jgi:BASS family bile acid:Na+ symporter